MTLIRLKRPPLAPPEWKTNVGVIYAQVHQRPYWSLRYTDGRIVNEWEVDWSLAPLKGRQKLRLYCPDGEYGEFGDTQDATGRLIQFKLAVRTMHAGATLAHVIGEIWGTDGQATLCAWELDAQGGGRRIGPWHDNVYHVAYHNIGRLCADHLGLADGEGR